MKTMKIMRRLMGCAAAILALSACSESEDLLSAFHSDPNAVRITAQVGKASADGFTRSNPLGSAEEQANFNENDEISVQAEGQDAVTYKYDGKEWQPQGNKFLKWEKETMNFTAYYPATFNGNITQPTEYTSVESLAAADFMSYSGPQTNTKDNKRNQLTLTMNRMMARVIVEIAGFNDQYTKNATVNSLSICGVKAYKHSDGKFYALIDPKYTPSTTAPFLSLEVVDGESKATEKYTTTPTAFVAGNSYTYQLKVGKNKISVSGITVADWDNTGIITEGSKAEQIIRYVTFTAEKEQKFKMTTSGKYTISGLQYSVNNGKWENVEKDIPVTFGGTNGTLRLRGTNINGTASSSIDLSNIRFTDKTVKVACTGDIRTLLDWRNYSTVKTQNARFCNLFIDCAVLTSAPELPATTLAGNCYDSMFSGCTSLTDAPVLPATKLADFCYSSMFSGCTSLTSAPKLSAEKLANNCYSYMFSNCNSLSTITMLAPASEINLIQYFFVNWLNRAGRTAASRTLKVQDEDAYNALVGTGYLPDIWKKGAENTTVLNKDNAEIIIE